MSVLKESVFNFSFCLVFVLLSASLGCAEWVFDDEGCVLPDGSSGNCINIYQCGPMMDYIRDIKTLSKETSERLNRYYCGVDEGTVKVCCPFEAITFPRINSDDSSDQSQKYEKLKLLPTDCGYLGTEDQIVGGSKTSIRDFPWMALLGYEEDDQIKFKCAGTIINDYYILTAAHCLAEADKPVVVRVGEHNLDKQIDCDTYLSRQTDCAAPAQDIEIAEMISHPKFNMKLRNNDIALIRLASRINTSIDTVKPICLPITSHAKNRNYVDENFVVTGWGVTETLRSSSELLKVFIPIINITKCIDTYKLLKVDISEERQFCVGGQLNKDSCNGDSGGPLQNVVEQGGNIKFVQYGIVSYGPKFCGRGLPGVYTRVDYYIDWILSKLKP